MTSCMGDNFHNEQGLNIQCSLSLFRKIDRDIALGRDDSLFLQAAGLLHIQDLLGH